MSCLLIVCPYNVLSNDCLSIGRLVYWSSCLLIVLSIVIDCLSTSGLSIDCLSTRWLSSLCQCALSFSLVFVFVFPLVHYIRGLCHMWGPVWALHVTCEAGSDVWCQVWLRPQPRAWPGSADTQITRLVNKMGGMEIRRIVSVFRIFKSIQYVWINVSCMVRHRLMRE